MDKEKGKTGSRICTPCFFVRPNLPERLIAQNSPGGKKNCPNLPRPDGGEKRKEGSPDGKKNGPALPRPDGGGKRKEDSPGGKKNCPTLPRPAGGEKRIEGSLNGKKSCPIQPRPKGGGKRKEGSQDTLPVQQKEGEKRKDRNEISEKQKSPTREKDESARTTIVNDPDTLAVNDGKGSGPKPPAKGGNKMNPKQPKASGSNRRSTRNKTPGPMDGYLTGAKKKAKDKDKGNETCDLGTISEEDFEPEGPREKRCLTRKKATPKKRSHAISSCTESDSAARGKKKKAAQKKKNTNTDSHTESESVISTTTNVIDESSEESETEDDGRKPAEEEEAKQEEKTLTETEWREREKKIQALTTHANTVAEETFDEGLRLQKRFAELQKEQVISRGIEEIEKSFSVDKKINKGHLDASWAKTAEIASQEKKGRPLGESYIISSPMNASTPAINNTIQVTKKKAPETPASTREKKSSLTFVSSPDAVIGKKNSMQQENKNDVCESEEEDENDYELLSALKEKAESSAGRPLRWNEERISRLRREEGEGFREAIDLWIGQYCQKKSNKPSINPPVCFMPPTEEETRLEEEEVERMIERRKLDIKYYYELSAQLSAPLPTDRQEEEEEEIRREIKRCEEEKKAAEQKTANEKATHEQEIRKEEKEKRDDSNTRLWRDHEEQMRKLNEIQAGQKEMFAQEIEKHKAGLKKQREAHEKEMMRIEDEAEKERIATLRSKKQEEENEAKVREEAEAEKTWLAHKAKEQKEKERDSRTYAQVLLDKMSTIKEGSVSSTMTEGKNRSNGRNEKKKGKKRKRETSNSESSEDGKKKQKKKKEMKKKKKCASSTEDESSNTEEEEEESDSGEENSNSSSSDTDTESSSSSSEESSNSSESSEETDNSSSSESDSDTPKKKKKKKKKRKKRSTRDKERSKKKREKAEKTERKEKIRLVLDSEEKTAKAKAAYDEREMIVTCAESTEEERKEALKKALTHMEIAEKAKKKMNEAGVGPDYVLVQRHWDARSFSWSHGFKWTDLEKIPRVSSEMLRQMKKDKTRFNKGLMKAKAEEGKPVSLLLNEEEEKERPQLHAMLAKLRKKGKKKGLDIRTLIVEGGLHGFTHGSLEGAKALKAYCEKPNRIEGAKFEVKLYMKQAKKKAAKKAEKENKEEKKAAKQSSGSEDEVTRKETPEGYERIKLIYRAKPTLSTQELIKSVIRRNAIKGKIVYAKQTYPHGKEGKSVVCDADAPALISILAHAKREQGKKNVATGRRFFRSAGTRKGENITINFGKEVVENLIKEYKEGEKKGKKKDKKSKKGKK